MQADRWRPWLLHPLLLLLWLGSFLLAAALEHAPHASLWFPPAAVTFAGLYCVGWRAAPAIFLACALGTWLTEAANQDGVRLDVLASSSLVFALVHTGAYALPAMVLRRLAPSALSELTLRAVSQFLVLGALGAMLAAVLGGVGLQKTNLLQAPDLFELASAWWIGDYAALVTLAPVLALLLRWVGGDGSVRRFPAFEWGQWRFRRTAAGKLALLFLATLAILVGYLEFSNSRALLVVLVLPVVLQLWIVHTENLASAQLGMLGFSLLTVGAAAGFNVGEDALILQFAAISLAANSYLSLAAPALYAANERLRDQVSHDGLTGALSRAWFEDRAALELANASRQGRPSSIVMLDVDGLKELNDTQGHAVGDLALRELVVRCKACLRGEDFIGRLGGDEFAIFLPGADETKASEVVRAIRAQLEAGARQSPDNLVAASFGIASTTDSSPSLSRLLQAADQAMYAEKRGRRRTP
ncbi:diguanylate cyclase domain-containing protein [Arenimonas sp.]|uniref:GGDEF domain-containing protein n=1 Tax=Arenimonas sp. TaxID=1872635 RepID=UPI0035AEC5A3